MKMKRCVMNVRTTAFLTKRHTKGINKSTKFQQDLQKNGTPIFVKNLLIVPKNKRYIRKVLLFQP